MDNQNPGSPPHHQNNDASLTENLKQHASQTIERARDEAHNIADKTRHDLADEVATVAQALRSAAGSLKSGSLQERGIGQLAESLAGASDTLSRNDLAGVARRGSDFARQNPALVVTGALFLGAAVGHFLKSHAPVPTTGSGTESDVFPTQEPKR